MGSDLDSSQPGGCGGDWGVTSPLGGHSLAEVMLGPFLVPWGRGYVWGLLFL